MSDLPKEDVLEEPLDFRKRTVTSPSLACDLVYRTSASFVTFLQGISQSCALAWGEMANKLTPDSVGQMDMSNGLIEGFAAGNARFFEELAKTSKETFEVCRRTPLADQEFAIDYDLLSKKVAEELQRARAQTKPPATPKQPPSA